MLECPSEHVASDVFRFLTPYPFRAEGENARKVSLENSRELAGLAPRRDDYRCIGCAGIGLVNHRLTNSLVLAATEPVREIFAASVIGPEAQRLA
jgi:hypothetical protein